VALSIGPDRHRLDVASAQHAIARIEEPIHDGRMGDDAPIWVLRQHVDARPDVLPVVVPRLVEGRHAQVGELRPLP